MEPYNTGNSFRFLEETIKRENIKVKIKKLLESGAFLFSDTIHSNYRNRISLIP